MKNYKTLAKAYEEFRNKGFIGKKLANELLYDIENLNVKGKQLNENMLSRAIKIDFINGLPRQVDDSGEFVTIDISKVACIYYTKVYQCKVYKDGRVNNVVYKQIGDDIFDKEEKAASRAGAKSTYNFIHLRGTGCIYGDRLNMQVTQHVMVAIAFGLFNGLTIEDIYSLVVNHKDGKRRNNNLSNLELCTDMENKIHGRVMGKNPNISSLTAAQAVKMYNAQKK